MSERPISETAVILVVDLQVGMFSGLSIPPISDASGLVERSRNVIDWARRTGRKLAFIRHDGGSPKHVLYPGSVGWPILAALGQQDDEPTFSKTVGNALSQPALVSWISNNGADEVVVIGAQSEKCVSDTACGALDRNLRVTVIGDAHSTWDDGSEAAAEIITRCNDRLRSLGANVMPAATLR